MSRAMAISILRKYSACASARLSKLTLPSLLTPSTSSATSPPKASWICAFAVSVSSITSCRIAATMVWWSSRISARMRATWIGWLMYGSPDARCWPSWASAPNRYAR